MQPKKKKDPMERALAHREEEPRRCDPKKIGFHMQNRGGIGIAPYHVHEVAWSCIPKFCLKRYNVVDVVQVPEKHLAEWRAMNKLKCENDAYMPQFSPCMTLAALTKTHLTHAAKLFQDGNRYLFNDNKKLLRVDPHDKEGTKIVEEEGILCCVYGEELWDDTEALHAIMDMDNENADVEMAEDEIQAQGRLDQVIKRAEDKVKDPAEVTWEMVMQEFAGTTKKTFTREQLACFVQFRLSLSESAAMCMRTCVFHVVCGRIRVQAADYKLVASLDVRAMMIKIAIIIHRYLDAYWQRFPKDFSSKDFSGRQPWSKAAAVKVSVVKELVGVEWVLWPNHFSLHHAHRHNRHPYIYTYMYTYVRTYMLTLMSAWT